MVNTRGSERKSRTPEENTDRENVGDENLIVVEDASANKTPEKSTQESPGVGRGKKRIKQRAGRFGYDKPSASTSSQGLPLVQPKQNWKKDQKVNIWCKTKVLTVLHQKMSDSQKNKLKKSFLAKFWDLPTGHFPTQLLLQIIRRRVKNDNKDVILFNFEGTVLDFTLKDFATITGLKCDSLRFTNLDKLPPSSIERSFFKSHSNRCLKSLIEELDDYDFSNDKMSLKLAKFTMLESIVIGKQHTNGIDDLHIRMVEDDDLFEDYPWGRVSFDLLRLSVVKSVGSAASQCLVITGFSYALIYWAFEVIPKLSHGEKYGRRVNSTEPRILNWEVMKLATCKELEKDIFNDQLSVVPLTAVADEGQYDYMAEFVPKRKQKDKEVVKDADDRGDEMSEEEVGEDEEDREGCKGKGDMDLATALAEVKQIIVSEFASLREKLDYLVDVQYRKNHREDVERQNVDEHRCDTMNKDDDDEANNMFVSDVMKSVMEGLDRMMDPLSNPTNVQEGEEPRAQFENEDMLEATNLVDEEQDDTRLENEVVADATKLSGEAEVRCGAENVVGCTEGDHVEMVIPTIDTTMMKVTDDVVSEEQTLVSGADDPDGSNAEGTLDAAASGAVAENERESRARNPGMFVREPYTDAFGSADPLQKKVPRKRRTDNVGRKAKRGGKRRKVANAEVDQDTVTNIPPNEAVDKPIDVLTSSGTQNDDGPNFNIGLTPLIADLQASATEHK